MEEGKGKRERWKKERECERDGIRKGNERERWKKERE